MIHEKIDAAARAMNNMVAALCEDGNAEGYTAVTEQLLKALLQPHNGAFFWGDRMLTLDKTAAFLHDEKFQAAISQATSSTGGAENGQPTHGISWRYNTLIWAARSCLTVPGDFVECGVFRGDMTWMITELVDIRPAGKRFYLYDTFDGFDPRYSSAEDFNTSDKFFEFASGVYKADGLETQVRERFSNKPYIHVVKGPVPDVLHSVAPARIAFLHLDMNSPRAETGALEVLYERISSGGMIVFDDYGWVIFQAQKKAADSFMASHGGNIILELPTGQGLMIKR